MVQISDCICAADVKFLISIFKWIENKSYVSRYKLFITMVYNIQMSHILF